MKLSADIVIVGSGVGGGTLASALAGSGARVLILERGKHLPREDENWNADAVFNQGRYATRENWKDERGKPYGANAYYHVGGASKMFGAAMFRFRERDFGALETADGVSPAWPISYADLEPLYFRAEKLFGVRGVVGEDPTEPWRSSPFPHPAVQHSDHLERGVVEALRRQGLSPAHLPLAIDEGASGSCQRCATCDAYPCRVGAKGDAERRAIEPALRSGNVQLLTNAHVRRIIAAPSGRSIVALEVMLAGEMATVNAAIFVVAAGAINSAKLLLASDHPRHSRGIANSAGHVGRNLMLHVSSAMVAVNPRQLEPIPFQKTLTINDFYLGRGGGDPPLPYGGTAIEFHGLKGSIRGDDVLWQKPQGRVTVTAETRQREIKVEHKIPYDRTMGDFVAAVRGKGEPSVSGSDGVASLSLTLAALEAIATGRKVRI